MAAEVAGTVQFGCARLALALAAGDRGRAIRRPARNLVEAHLALERIGQADHHHAEMQEVGDEREQGRLLAAMLGGGRGEGRADLAVQRAPRPEAACPVQKGRHLRREASITGAGPDDNRVVARQLFNPCDRRRLVELIVALAGYVLWHSFGHAFDIHLGPR
jgi:hypothetical protein